MWIVTGAAFVLYSLSLSYAAGKDLAILRSRGVQLAAIGIFFALFSLTMYFVVHSGFGVRGLVACFPVMVLGIGAAYRFFPYLISEWFDAGARAIIGVDRMTIRRSYDLAEKAEHAREYDQAIALYLEETRRDASDPEPWRRIAEIHVRRERYEEAVAPYKEAARLTKHVEDQVTIQFRLSDVLLRLGRTDEAKRILEDVARVRKGTKFAEFAQERLKSCR